MRKYFILIIAVSFSFFILAQSKFNYPDTKKIDLVEDYQGAYNFSNAEEQRLESFLKTHGGKLYPMPPKF